MGEREAPERSRASEEAEIGRIKPKASIFTLKNIAILISGVVLSSLLAIFAVGNYIAPALEQRNTDRRTVSSSGSGGEELDNLTFYRIEPMVVNPAGSNGERYLKAKIALEMHDPELQTEIDKRLPQIKNQINNVLSSKTILQIQTNEDRERLRREIQNRVNGLLVGGQVYNVYFEEFVYQ
ncbi:flagellar basal body-associated FliL family protein [Candidatus Poribacteria bacterium]|nr:flagellar basal body-associated FliL family protein [Candidatus Poribacteria bacterium]